MRLTTAPLLAALCMLAAGCASRADLMETAVNGSDGEQAREALLELRRNAHTVSSRTLESVLRDQRNPGARVLATEMLGGQRAVGAADELLESARRDRAWPVRAAALQALADLQGQAAVEELNTAMRTDIDPQVRVKALRELKNLLSENSEQFDEALNQALLDSATIVRLQASQYLTRKTGLNAAPDLRSWNDVRAE